MRQLVVTQSDYGLLFKIGIINDDKEAIDLTGATVSGVIVKPNGTKTNITIPIIDAVKGIVQYQLTATDTSILGNHIIYIEINGGSYKLHSNQTISYNVIAKDGGVI